MRRFAVASTPGNTGGSGDMLLPGGSGGGDAAKIEPTKKRMLEAG
jgi:hypothetical protein